MAMNNCRHDFPWINTKGLVYLDSAATTHKPQGVLDAVMHAYTHVNAPVYRGVYQAAEDATSRLESVRDAVARFINAATPSEVVFTHNTTHGLNLVAQGWARSVLKPGDEIAVSALEHHSNLAPWLVLAQELGVTVRVFDMNRFAENITPKTKLVAATLSSNVVGDIDPCVLHAGIAAAHAVGARVVLDAAQWVGHHKLDVQELGADFVAFSSHKMYGPHGVGVLYIKTSEHELMRPVVIGGGMVYAMHHDHVVFKKIPHMLEAGTPDIAGILGFGAAIAYLETVGYHAIEAHEARLMQELLTGLQALSGVNILGPLEQLKKSHLVCFTVAGYHPHDVAALLAQEGICVRAGDHCNQPLHQRLGLTGSVRVSIALYTSSADIQKFLYALEQITKHQVL